VIVEFKEKNVRIAPHLFNDEQAAVAAEIHKKYSNKVLPNVGLCICICDILSISQGYVYIGDGASFVEVHFRLIVFRPFIGEVLTGSIAASTQSGLKVSLLFFDNIIIPGGFIKPSAYFDSERSVWLWQVDEHDLEMRQGEPVRFKVTDVVFSEQAGPRVRAANSTSDTGDSTPKIPLISIFGTTCEDGLGMIEWWR